MRNEVIIANKSVSPAIVDKPWAIQTTAVTGRILYAVIFIILAAAAAYLLGITVVPGYTTPQAILAPAVTFILLGILFSVFLYRAVSSSKKLSFNGGLGYALVVLSCIFSICLLSGYLKGNTSVTSGLFYSSLFFIPFSIYQTWVFYQGLSSFISYRKIWYVPDTAGIVPKATVFLNSVHVKIKIAPSEGEIEKVYKATVPGRMSIGNMFDNFIYDENNMHDEEIDIKDVNSKLYGWQFYTPVFMGLSNRQIDPDLSLDDNGITKNTVIKVKRIQNQLQLT